MKKRKGLSLIEVLLSMALLSLIGLILLSIFGFSLTNIKKSGDRTGDIYELEKEINIEIAGNGVGNDQVIIKAIFHNEPDYEGNISGRLIKKTKNGKEIVTFVPNK